MAMSLPAALSPDAWVLPVFSAKSACQGGVIRRKIRDIEKYVGKEAFVSAVHPRGYHALETAGQMIIFCNQEPVRRIL
ncbi:MAG: hypothetical protein ACJAVM_000510 [Sulfitobacter sp.]|jgi:hypothetical protein